MRTTSPFLLIAIALVGCASAGHIPDPRPACIRLVVRNDTPAQANVYADGTTSSRRRIATVASLSHETVWLEARDLDANGRFSASVHHFAGDELSLSPIPVKCHDGTLHLHLASQTSTSSLFVAAR